MADLSILNRKYPLSWIVIGQVLLILISSNDAVAAFFAAAYDNYLYFIKLNSAPEFSENAYKGYTALLMMLIPFQTLCLVLGGHEKIGVLLRARSKKHFFITLFVFIAMCFFLIFFFNLGHYGLLRLLSNILIVSMVTPLVTSFIAMTLSITILSSKLLKGYNNWQGVQGDTTVS